MTEDEQRKFEFYETLRSAAWVSYANRGPHEWKVCISLWTALVLISGSILNYKDAINISLTQYSLFIALMICICIMHHSWLVGLHNANRVDREKPLVLKK